MNDICAQFDACAAECVTLAIVIYLGLTLYSKAANGLPPTSPSQMIVALHLASSDIDAYVPGHQSTGNPINVDDEEHVLVPRNLLTGTQLILHQVLQDKNLTPALESQIIVTLEQLVNKTGILPARYNVSDGVTISSGWVTNGGVADIYQGDFQGQFICVKVNKEAKDKQDAVRKNTLKEAVLCGSLSHPNIVPFIGVYFNGITPTLVYPWMGNGDLLSYLKRSPNADRNQL
ncbi:hypothetical protein H0H92_013497, partial [Tricholoma furcatifolium]